MKYLNIPMMRLLFSLLAACMLFSCKVKQKPTEAISSDKIDATENDEKNSHKIATTLAFYEKILIPPTFEHLKINGKIDIQMNDAQIPTLNSTMYIAKNEKIWINISVLLLNVARGQITPDGIQGYIKTEREYIDSDFQYFNNLLGVDLFQYKTIEKLLIGQTFIRPNSRDYQMYKMKNGYSLASISPQFFGKNKDTSYNIKLNYTESYDLEKVEIQDTKTENKLSVEYSEWTEFEKMKVPKYVKIIIKGEKSGEIIIENTKFENQKVNTPFSIPKNYSKIKIK